MERVPATKTALAVKKLLEILANRERSLWVGFRTYSSGIRKEPHNPQEKSRLHGPSKGRAGTQVIRCHASLGQLSTQIFQDSMRL